jgi:hypothetical protein
MDEKQECLQMPDSQDLASPPTKKPAESRKKEGECPYHKAFHYECRYCNPR